MRHLLKSAAAKGFLLTALLLFAASICRAQSVAPETPDYILRSGGMERTYKLHLPAGLPENAPLVVVLHGYGGNNNPDRFAMNATADRHGFRRLLPAGRERRTRQELLERGIPLSGRHDRRRRAVPDRAGAPFAEKARTEPAQHLLHRHVERRRDVLPAGGAASPPVRRRGAGFGTDARLALQSGPEYRAGSALRNPRHGGQDLGMAGRSAKQRRLGSLSARARWPYITGRRRTAAPSCRPTRCRQRHPAAAR